MNRAEKLASFNEAEADALAAAADFREHGFPALADEMEAFAKEARRQREALENKPPVSDVFGPPLATRTAHRHRPRWERGGR